MKNQVNPIIAIAAILVLVLIAGFVVWRGSSAGHEDSAKPPGMPAEAAAEFQKRMGSSNTTGPPKSATGTATGLMGGGGYLAPPGSPAPR